MQRANKRFFDIVVSALGLVVFSPLMAIIAVSIWVSSGRPLFFSQLRVGRNGRLFKCHKFRTMHQGAQKQGTVTSSSDNRFTAEGKFLRKFKLDELPQLWNVLTGKMSFVGPRPDVSGYADALEGEQRKILTLRPGITGPASIYFRHEEHILSQTQEPLKTNDTLIWPIKVRINCKYIDQWSYSKDIGYILITVFPFLNRWFRLIQPSPLNLEEVE
ncbi:UDP-N-acetylgalactosaminyltransferase [Chitinispirillum alkaliphilum]|nr:UDP-N-acetylgalactosaminyltransferase [Chitinispirillum alkaliphilum]